MKYKLTIHEDVLEEVVQAAIYYDTQQIGLGEKLLIEWEKAIEKIVRLPEGYQKKKKYFREALLDRFPFVIIFETTANEVLIYRFINLKRHAGKRYAKRKS